jgi:hypothetical protein
MEPKDLLDKLEKVERAINIYNSKTEDLVKEIPINIPIERLKGVVAPKEGDPLLYRGYILDANQLEQLNYDLGNVIKPDFNRYYYVLECHGIYNWQ